MPDTRGTTDVNVARIAAITVLLMSPIGQNASAADGSAASTVKAVCAKCHGPNGSGTSPLFPRLAGQQAAYLERQLRQFRERSRGDAHARAYMWGIAKPLSDVEIHNLATYLAARPPAKPSEPVNPELAARGREIFEHGVAERNVPACANCHGRQAQGMQEIPRLAGQHRDYIYRQIQEFRGLLRKDEIMHEQTKNVSDEEALAVAEYLSSK